MNSPLLDQATGAQIEATEPAPPATGRVGAQTRPAAPAVSLRRVDWAIFVVVLLASLYVLPRWADPNQNSRLDMVLAVVNDGSFRIDAWVHNTVDYARVGDAFYSDKAPGAAFLIIPFYAAARPLLERALATDAADSLAQGSAFRSSLRPDGSGVSTDKLRFAALQMLAAALVAALPTALTALLLWRLALRFTASPAASALAALGWALLTPAFAYSNAVYGHQLCAFLLVAAFALVAMGPGIPGVGRMFLLGLLLAAAVVTEYPAVLASGLIFLYAAWRAWKAGATPRIAWTLLAGALVAAPWMAYNRALFGGPLALGYEHSELWTAQHSTGFMSLSWPTFDGFWGITFSPFRGLFVLAPWLLLAAPGFVHWWRWSRFRAEWFVTVGSVCIWFLFNAASHMWWGGFAVGPRYLLPALPFLALGAAAALATWLDKPVFRAVLAALALWSLVATWGLALADQAYPPDSLLNPFTRYALPAWQQGNLARSLGTLAGLPGPVALLPLVVIVAGGVAVIAATLRTHGGGSAAILAEEFQAQHAHP